MAENKIEIIIEAVDKASKEIQSLRDTISDLEKKVDSMKKKHADAADTIEKGFKAAGKEIKDFAKAMFVVTAVIGTIAKLTSEWAKSNEATHNAVTSLKNNVAVLAGQLGSLLAPAIIGISSALKQVMPTVTNFFDNLRKGFNKFNQWVTYGVQYWVAFAAALKEGSSSTEAAGIALNVAGEAAKQAGESFDNAFSTSTNEKINALEESLKKLGDTWVSWSDETTRDSMATMTEQIVILQETISAYENYYAELARLQNEEQMNWVKDTNAKASLIKYIQEQNRTAWQNVSETAISVTNKFQTSFASAMGKLAMEGGKFKDAMNQVFKDMARNFIEQVASMIAKWLSFIALKGIFSLFGGGGLLGGVMHEGGDVDARAKRTVTVGEWHRGGFIKAHSGLALDEVPIIAQTGEGILSRRGMANLGGSGMLNRLNNGGGAGQTINIEINYPSIRSMDDIDSLTEAISSRLAREADRL
jgi:hypothetical protein